MPRNLNAVNISFENSRMMAQHLTNFVRAHILALPAKIVSNPINEVPPSLLVPTNKISGSKPSITLLEHIAQNLLLCCFVIVQVALVLLYYVIRIKYV